VPQIPLSIQIQKHPSGERVRIPRADVNKVFCTHRRVFEGEEHLWELSHIASARRIATFSSQEDARLFGAEFWNLLPLPLKTVLQNFQDHRDLEKHLERLRKARKRTINRLRIKPVYLEFDGA